MSNRLARFHKVAALGRKPTPTRRWAAAAIAGSIAFVLTQVLLGIIWGAGSSAVIFSSVAFAIAAGLAAANTRPGLAIVYGLLGAVWLLIEGVMAMIGLVAACLG